MSEHEKIPGAAARLLEQLQRSQAFHLHGATVIEQPLRYLRRWQSARLARTHADLLRNPRYRPAALFFLDELYGDCDFLQRERDLERVVPAMSRVLPAHVLHTAALALELNVLSHELDAIMTQILVENGGLDTPDALDEARYVAAYRRCGHYEHRARQLYLVERLGDDLARIVPKRFIHAALVLSRTPARLAGVGELHRFLEAGFSAFRHLGSDAATFVATIIDRERVILEHMRDGHPRPLELADADADADAMP